MKRFSTRQTIKAILCISVVISLGLNISLLKDANKLNLDSLKWSIKSLTFKYSDMINGKIPLLEVKMNFPERNQGNRKNADVIYKQLISKAAKHYSIFGLDPTDGFEGLPKGLPNWAAKCGSRLGLDKKVFFVSASRHPNLEFTFFNSNSALNALTGSVIASPECKIERKITIQKSTLAWLVREQFNLKLKPDQLPAHFSLVNDKNLIVISRLGEARFVNFVNGHVSISQSTDLGLRLLNSQPHTHFGVKSILLGKRNFFVAAARNDDSCNRLEIYSFPLDKQNLRIEVKSKKVIYKSPGCFNSATTELNAIGGRLIFSNSDNTNLIFSLGNAEIWTGLEDVSVNENYGVISNLDLVTGKSKIISRGHRNPQGICVHQKDIYETEQGPDGGDEFNQIVRGKNYGWPRETYGAPYGDFYKAGLSSRRFGSHEFYYKPMISWVPAIAIGDLICPSSKDANPWGSSFIAATLKDNSLRRLVLDSGAIRVDERIPMNDRIRDIQYNSEGDLIAITDSGQIISLHLIARGVQ